MSIRFRCPCGQKLKTSDETEGRRARCPKCGEWLRVPKSSTYDIFAQIVGLSSDQPSTAGVPPVSSGDTSSAEAPPVSSHGGAPVKAADAPPVKSAAPSASPGAPGISKPHEPPAGGPTAQPIQPPKMPDPALAPKARVLVAESNPAERKDTARILRAYKYVVLEAADGAQAIELIRKERPDAVIVNVRLEGMSGFHVIEQIRNMANERNKDVWQTPVLMTTAKLQGREKQYSMSLGVEGFFVKPVPVDELISKLEKLTAHYQALK